MGFEEKGIDISHWQGDIDWGRVAASGIKFAIIKAGGSDKDFYKDSKFEFNYAHAKMHGIKVGAYYFAGKGCCNTTAGVIHANEFLHIIKDKQFEYPVVLDFEVGSVFNKAGNTDACISFCKRLEECGYYASIYASDISGFRDQLDLSRLKDFDKWVARYGKEPVYVKQYGIWQHSSKGSVPGIKGNVDLDLSYKDYSHIIKKVKLNGFS